MVTLVPAKINDAEIDEVRALCASNPTYWRYSGDFDPEAVPRDGVETMLRDEAARPESEVLLARDDAGYLVGLVMLLRRHPTDGYPWIGLLLIDGRRQRQGHGGAIVAAVEQRFRDEGRDGLRLSVLTNNVEALAFWAAARYHEIARKPDLDKGRPTLVMHKDLREAR